MRRGRALHRRYGRAFGQKVAATTPEFEATLARFVSSAQAMIDDHNDKFFANARARVNDPSFGAKKLSLERGPKYIRVVVSDSYGDSKTGAGRSVYCFIDTTNGNILKSASWKAPAKHARGNIFDADPLQGVTQYGAQYLRR